MVRTPPSQGGNRGSNPLGVTKTDIILFKWCRFFICYLKIMQNNVAFSCNLSYNILSTKLRKVLFLMVNKNLHQGHRERVRERINKGGLECLSDIETLEYLLFFTIPRENTNTIAHNLINTFGSFKRVLEATPDELMRVEGIGQKSAALISSYLPLFQRYQRHCLKPKSTIYNSTDKILKFFQNECMGKQVENSYALYLNQSRRIIKLTHFTKGTFNQTQIFVDQVVKEAITLNARYVIVAHNHTSGNVFPSEADCNTAVDLFNALQLVEKDLADFVIVDHFDDFSFVEHDIITEEGITNIYKRPSKLFSMQNDFPEFSSLVQDDEDF